MKTLLIVDDDSNIRLLLRDEFAERGYNVVTAVDGEEAVISFHEQSVDLVILDLRMPKLDGGGVLKTIRSSNKIVPIIIYTANPNDVPDYESYGNVKILIKGADLSPLFEEVTKQIDV